MKVIIRALLPLSCLMVWLAAPAHGQEGRLRFAHLDRFGDTAADVIEVTVDEKIIKLALSAINPKRSPDEAKVYDLIKDLKGIYVKRYVFEKEGEYLDADVTSIRAQLDAPGWSRVANVRSKRKGNFDVVIMSEGSVIKGLAVLAAEPKALTVVNVVGPIDLAALSQLQGKFGIPSLGLEAGGPADKPQEDKQ